MDAHETINVIDGFFNLFYTENRGMAFGTTFGDSVWAKYALSLFRIGAIVAIAVYIKRLIQDPKTHMGLVYAMSLILAGAAGNLIDGMFYDLIWDLDMNFGTNYQQEMYEGRKIPMIRDGQIVPRESGFLLGSVVDMFQFTAKWPAFFPQGMAGSEIFGAIWNVADAAISGGVALIILRYRTFFRHANAKMDENGELIIEAGISRKRWLLYLLAAFVVFIVFLIVGSHLWAKMSDGVDPGIMALVSLVAGFSTFWGLREYIK